MYDKDQINILERPSVIAKEWRTTRARLVDETLRVPLTSPRAGVLQESLVPDHYCEDTKPAHSAT